MKRVLALSMLIPATVVVLAAPASAKPPSKALCSQTFAVPATDAWTGTVAYVIPGMSDNGTFVGAYGVSAGTTVDMRSCMFYDQDRDGRFDRHEPNWGDRLVDSVPADDPFGYGIWRFGWNISNVPDDGQLCLRTSYRTTYHDTGETSVLYDNPVCFLASAEEL